MLKELVFLVMVGCAVGSHSPSGGKLIPDIVELLWIHADIDDDPEVTETEFLREFINNFDHDTSGVVSEHEFQQQWSHSFHESSKVSGHVFQNMDLDGDGELSRDDLVRLFHHMDYDGSNNLSKGEFFTMVAYIYGRIPYD